MGPYFLKCCGVLCTFFGLFLVGVGPYLSHLYNFSLLTEVAVGVFLTWFGTYLVILAKKQSMDKCADEEEDDFESGKSSPFYYELEPLRIFQRELPPIPKDIGGLHYASVVLDKV